MSKNHEIQTASKFIAASAVANIGGVVPAGMTRYVTFVRIEQTTSVRFVGPRLYLCSGTASVGTTDALATAVAKLVITPTSDVPALALPPSPDTEHPLFSVAAGKYLNAHLASADEADGAGNLFVQFFDE
jgi:hypothetical protein